MSDTEVLAILRASPGRRFLGMFCMGGLGLLLVWVAVARPPGALPWQAFLILLGGLSLWLANAMRRATAMTVELTRTELRMSDGSHIVAIDDIDTMDRSMFAFKPSNGFLIRTKTKAPGQWHPGLWWRMGRRIGIGGVTPGHHSKAMADIVAALVAERDTH